MVKLFQHIFFLYFKVVNAVADVDEPLPFRIIRIIKHRFHDRLPKTLRQLANYFELLLLHQSNHTIAPRLDGVGQLALVYGDAFADELALVQRAEVDPVLRVEVLEQVADAGADHDYVLEVPVELPKDLNLRREKLHLELLEQFIKLKLLAKEHIVRLEQFSEVLFDDLEPQTWRD